MQAAGAASDLAWGFPSASPSAPAPLHCPESIRAACRCGLQPVRQRAGRGWGRAGGHSASGSRCSAGLQNRPQRRARSPSPPSVTPPQPASPLAPTREAVADQAVDDDDEVSGGHSPVPAAAQGRRLVNEVTSAKLCAPGARGWVLGGGVRCLQAAACGGSWRLGSRAAGGPTSTPRRARHLLSQAAHPAAGRAPAGRRRAARAHGPGRAGPAAPRVLQAGRVEGGGFGPQKAE